MISFVYDIFCASKSCENRFSVLALVVDSREETFWLGFLVVCLLVPPLSFSSEKG